VPVSSPYRGRPRLPRPKRRVLWRTVSLAAAIQVGAGQTSSMELLNVESSDMDEFAGATLTRILLDLYIWTSSEVLGGFVIWGAGIVPLERDTVAAGAFPDPLTDEANWIYNQRGILQSSLNAATAVNRPGLASQYIHQDLHGQRKVGVRDTIIFLMENVAGAPDLTYYVSTRTLYKLS